MPDKETPEVVFDQVFAGARPIAAVGTSTAGFVGRAPTEARHDEAVAIDSWEQFVSIYIAKDGGLRHLSEYVQEGTKQHLAHASQGVNCIRLFRGEGIRVWGARTLSTSHEWRYINIRRLVNMIQQSIALNTRWAVLEPNDNSLWKLLRRDVSAFLRSLWRDGALAGATSEEAFFVKCDADTNPPADIENGRVVVLIGIAAVRPAEFLIFRIIQTKEGAVVG